MPLTLHDLVADKLERADAATRENLLRIPLDNIDRWIANGHSAPDRLEQWRRIVQRAQQSPEGFDALLALLRDRRAPSERLREFAPVAGVLTAAERARIIRQCAYSH
jgi:hypothetical protein